MPKSRCTRLRLAFLAAARPTAGQAVRRPAASPNGQDSDACCDASKRVTDVFGDRIPTGVRRLICVVGQNLDLGKARGANGGEVILSQQSAGDAGGVEVRVFLELRRQ